MTVHFDAHCIHVTTSLTFVDGRPNHNTCQVPSSDSQCSSAPLFALCRFLGALPFSLHTHLPRGTSAGTAYISTSFPSHCELILLLAPNAITPSNSKGLTCDCVEGRRQAAQEAALRGTNEVVISVLITPLRAKGRLRQEEQQIQIRREAGRVSKADGSFHHSWILNAGRSGGTSSKPPPYKHLRRNTFFGRSHVVLSPDEIQVCECGPSDGCPLDQCLNAVTHVECTPGTCPCGELCQNQVSTRMWGGVT